LEARVSSRLAFESCPACSGERPASPRTLAPRGEGDARSEPLLLKGRQLECFRIRLRCGNGRGVFPLPDLPPQSAQRRIRGLQSSKPPRQCCSQRTPCRKWRIQYEGTFNPLPNLGNQADQRGRRSREVCPRTTRYGRRRKHVHEVPWRYRWYSNDIYCIAEQLRSPSNVLHVGGNGPYSRRARRDTSFSCGRTADNGLRKLPLRRSPPRWDLRTDTPPGQLPIPKTISNQQLLASSGYEQLQ
jgi:hypothetical protein